MLNASMIPLRCDEGRCSRFNAGLIALTWLSGRVESGGTGTCQKQRAHAHTMFNVQIPIQGQHLPTSTRD